LDQHLALPLGAVNLFGSARIRLDPVSFVPLGPAICLDQHLALPLGAVNLVGSARIRLDPVSFVPLGARNLLGSAFGGASGANKSVRINSDQLRASVCCANEASKPARNNLDEHLAVPVLEQLGSAWVGGKRVAGDQLSELIRLLRIGGKRVDARRPVGTSGMQESFPMRIRWPQWP
jgi:hypothetical protein